MLFNSFSFFIFFPVVTVAYFLLPHRYRWMLLLAASCYFYMAFIPVYILILVVTIIVDYVAGILIEDSTGKRRKFFLVASIVANLGVLAFFKYFNFFNTNIAELYSFLGLHYPIQNLSIILPIGLSFHTFQSISYTIEVYRGHQESERHFGIFALYVLFYPQLVAGPIERPQNMLPQFHKEHYFDYERVTSGLKLMTWGLFKKVVIADRLAVIVNEVYNNPSAYEGPALILATFCFAYQIYCDFSGYTDIARGAAQVMGYDLMLNFRQPYFSKSIAEFWSRWHISLSTWFRDYLYIPLGGNRVSKMRWQINLVIVFAISGLWHGASWNFVIWGLLHGFYLIASIQLGGLLSRFAESIGIGKLPRLYAAIQIFITFVLVCFAWIFFRAATLQDSIYVITHLTTGFGDFFQQVLSGQIITPFTKQIIVVAGPAFAAMVLLEIAQYVQLSGSMREKIAARPVWQRWAAYYGIVAFLVVFGIWYEESGSQFIYFQF